MTVSFAGRVPLHLSLSNTNEVEPASLFFRRPGSVLEPGSFFFMDRVAHLPMIVREKSEFSPVSRPSEVVDRQVSQYCFADPTTN